MASAKGSEDPAPGSRFLLRLGAVGILAGVYFALGKLGLSLAFVHPSATAVWPPTGITLAALLVLGYGVWPGVFLGAFLVNLTTAGTVGTSLGIAAGNTLEGLVGAYLVNRFANGRQAFDRPKDILKFVILAGMMSTMVSATLGVTSLSLGGFAAWTSYRSIWLTWWLGDLAGDLLIAPVLLLWSLEPRPGWRRTQVLEALLLLLFLYLVGQVVFGGFLSVEMSRYPLEFVCIPFLIWAAFRFGTREAATANLILAGIAIRKTLQGFGPFAGDHPNESLLLLQAFMGVTSVMALSLSAVISERARAQEELRRQAVDLARSNAELAQFASVASHDMQEPLRMISSHLQLLEHRYKGRLDPDAERFISFAVDGAKRMQAMIRDLLVYSRLGTGEETFGLFDCGEIVEATRSQLARVIGETGTVITTGSLPVVRGRRTEFLRLLQNLVDNAIKYRREVPPQIHIASELRASEWVFSVQDNGIGIRAEHQERIFRPFQRLHDRDERSGSGIGLTIAKKVVEQHGGRLWVESEPEKGSTFFFTLPSIRS